MRRSVRRLPESTSRIAPVGTAATTVTTDHALRAQCYFVAIVSAINLEKYKEATDIRQEFTDMVESLPELSLPDGVDNPSFWHSQSNRIWEQEIRRSSQSLRS